MDFYPVETVRASDESGLLAEITAKKTPRGFVQYTFAFFKEFELERGGETKRTSFIPSRALRSLRNLIDQIEDRILLEQDKLAAKRRTIVK